jgi:serine/threonine protein kinase
MIAFLCSGCGARLRVKGEFAGTKGKCPRCGQSIEAPRSEASDAASPPPQPGRANGGARAVFEADSALADIDIGFLAPPREPGELGRLGSYRVLKILGSGGMGIVFQAEDLNLKRMVALKAMKSHIAAKPDNRQRFLREAQLAAAIEHDHVITIYQVGEDRGIPFLAMKLLQGESLEDRIDRLNKSGSRLELAEILRIGREIAEGLAAAHARGLIHRDIKPANVWLEAGRDRVKIVDFGLARAATEEDGRLTQEGMLIGTPAYMSPEQADGAPLDHRADLFSLGCVLYRMGTGRLPFKGKNTMAMLMALATKRPVPPQRLNPELPPALSDLVMELLTKDPAGRPQSAREVADTLEEIEQSVADGTAFPPEVEEVEEVEEVRTAGPRRPRGERRVVPADEDEEDEEEHEARRTRREVRRREARRRRKRSEAALERRVIKFGILVIIAVVLLIVFLIGKSIWKSSHPESQIAPPNPVPTRAARRFGKDRRGYKGGTIRKPIRIIDKQRMACCHV